MRRILTDACASELLDHPHRRPHAGIEAVLARKLAVALLVDQVIRLADLGDDFQHVELAVGAVFDDASLAARLDRHLRCIVRAGRAIGNGREARGALGRCSSNGQAAQQQGQQQEGIAHGRLRKMGVSGWGQRKSWISRRSEEHTSELQSPKDLVCRLLLEKKKLSVFRDDVIFLMILYQRWIYPVDRK